MAAVSVKRSNKMFAFTTKNVVVEVKRSHRTNNELQNRIKWPWIEPRLHRKSNNKPKFT